MPPTPTAIQATRLPGRIDALDGLRGVAVLLVMGFHFAAVYPLADSGRLDRLAEGLLQSGWCGVDLFFVLSGFLITGILYDSRASAHFFRNFYARRVLRIFPLYYGLLAVCFLVLPWFSLLAAADCRRIAADQGWYWLFLSNIKMAVDGPPNFGPISGMAALTWSLAIEEQFYLLWPLLVFVFRRETLLRLCVAMAIGAMVLRIAWLFADAPRTSIYVLTPCRFDGLAIGAWIALVLRGPTDRGLIRRAASVAAMISGVGLGGLFLVHGSLRAGLASTLSLGMTLLAVLFGAVVALAVVSPAENRLVRTAGLRILRTFGKYSFAIYLLHQPIFQALAQAGAAAELPRVLGSRLPAYAAGFAAASLLALLAAMASWHLYERRFLTLKRYFEARESGVRPLRSEPRAVADAIAGRRQKAGQLIAAGHFQDGATGTR
jgi:peptidoglycan/LPS O-acetylase OafA/YrhL